jgi:hypothetical protein
MSTLDRNLKKALLNFEKAVRAHEMMGAQPPGVHSDILKDYRRTKERLVDILKRVPHESIRERSDAKIQPNTVPENRHSK